MLGLVAILAGLVPPPSALAGANTLSIANETVVEGPSSATVVARFKVSLLAPAAGSVTVKFRTVDGTATAPGDYTARNGTLTIADGQKARNVAITVQGDDIDETDETFRVLLSDPTNATIADASGVGRITDDDGPAISVADAATQPPVTEGGAGQTVARVRFRIKLSDPSPQQVRVRASTVDLAPGPSHATAGVDYVALSNVLVTFPPNVTNVPLDVTVLGDWKPELAQETFELHLSHPVDASIADGVATGHISNDDCGSSDPGPGAASDLGAISGDQPMGVQRTSTIACNNEVDWYRFRLSEENNTFLEDLHVVIVLLVGDAPAQGGGNLDLCVYRSNGTVQVGCSRRTGVKDERLEILRDDAAGDSGIDLWVNVLPRTRGPNSYTLRIDGDAPVTDPIEL
jgi:hypothetical protein